MNILSYPIRLSLIITALFFTSGCDEEKQATPLITSSVQTMCDEASAHVMSCTGVQEKIFSGECIESDAQLEHTKTRSSKPR